MVSKALKQMLSDVREPMLQEDEIPLQVNLWRVLVQPLPAKKRKNEDSMIELPNQVLQAEEYRTSVGRVLQMGSFAYKSKTQSGLDLSQEPVLPKVGDYVLYETYAGQEIVLNGKPKLRVLLDTEILAVVDDPEAIRNYI